MERFGQAGAGPGCVAGLFLAGWFRLFEVPPFEARVALGLFGPGTLAALALLLDFCLSTPDLLGRIDRARPAWRSVRQHPRRQPRHAPATGVAGAGRCISAMPRP